MNEPSIVHVHEWDSTCLSLDCVVASEEAIHRPWQGHKRRAVPCQRLIRPEDKIFGGVAHHVRRTLANELKVGVLGATSVAEESMLKRPLNVPNRDSATMIPHLVAAQ